MSLKNTLLTFKEYNNNYIHNSKVDELTNDWGWYIDIDNDMTQRKHHLITRQTGIKRMNRIRLNKSIDSLQDLNNDLEDEDEDNLLYCLRNKNDGFINDSIYQHTLGLFGVAMWYYFAYLC